MEVAVQDKLDDGRLKRIRRFTTQPDFTPDVIGNVSAAARGIAM